MASIRTEIYSAIRLIFLKVSPLWFQRIVEKRKEKFLTREFYNLNQSSDTNEVICMIDGKVKHGGLSDRVNGIISCFDCALKSNRNFKIIFNSPFNLLDYLIPHKYDWIIDCETLIYGNNSKPIFLRSLNTNQERERGLQLLSEFKKSNDKQLHVYSNINSVDPIRYNQLFNILFKPSDQLNTILNNERAKIGGKYVSATFRFQQLLNDFKEGDYRVLPEVERGKLIEKCVKAIECLHQEFPDHKILVTSDSSTFLERIMKYPYTHIITGKMVHMEYTNNNDFSVHAKAFVDLYLISEAEIIHSVVVKPMYESGFPKLASKVNNRPFKLLTN